MRCLRCRGRLVRSGQEVYRVECDKCGQNYFMAMQLVEVDSKRPPLLESEASGVERSSGSAGSGKIPEEGE